jgi:predicted PhzF superfamily epimerase YddE/YHI9/ribosomal protein S18 acetylase RimI-like enzyme
MESILSQTHFRNVYPTDIPACAEIEQDSYPQEEAASKSSLQYRQHQAAPYFRCAVLEREAEEEIVGYICSTRCREFNHESIVSHDTSGPLLAIHSVVVSQTYRSQGIAVAMMKDYIAAIAEMNNGRAGGGIIDKLVLIAKTNLLGFYVQCGFIVTGVSSIVHGQDLWYGCELVLQKKELGAAAHPCWVLDSFAEPGKSGNYNDTGNPAAVVLLPSDFDCELEREWMKTVAKEFHLSETAFIWPSSSSNNADAVSVAKTKKEKEEEQEELVEERSDDEYENGGVPSEKVANYVIRYFTANGTEVDLCGHATLASAAVLFQTLKIKKDATILFTANNDLLSASLQSKSKTFLSSSSLWQRPDTPMKLKMDFPKRNVREISASQDQSCIIGMLKAAFGMEFPAKDVLYIGLDENGDDVLVELTRDYFLEIGYDNIHYAALMEWSGYSRGVILCCLEEYDEDERGQDEVASCENKSDSPPVDFLSRFFGPKAGIMEDPVTGSAHCILGPYFGTKLNKTTLIGKQTSRRGGLVTCILAEERVSIVGTAVTTVSGYLHIPTTTNLF